VSDPRFLDNPARTQRAVELSAELEPLFATRTTAEWLAIFEPTGMPVGPVNDMAAAYADPQVQAREMVVELEHPVAGRIKNIGVPVKLSETPGKIRRPAPSLGQHSAEILGELGFSAEGIEAMRAAGVIH
jgi:CoA:oxalate CoA-transferase